ncbi:MAG: NAD(P)/FAD-dependent oxidoreductase [Candidatus Krumholzibacteriia bacterium]
MIGVVGGGPAGYFAAITARETAPGVPVVLFEKASRTLRKVKISGGGRCNVTHACFDARALAGFYPRGHRELIGPFTRFGAAETVAWFAERGVKMRTYPDGCLFPESNDSQTVIDCLEAAARRAGVQIRTRVEVAAIRRDGGGFRAETVDGATIALTKVLIATGGKAPAPGHTGPYQPQGGYALAAGLGHTITAPVPSLFTFTVKDPLLDDLAGIVVENVEATARPPGKGPRLAPQTGPLLITHWGLSGPAVLKLSAWGARKFHEAGYRFPLTIDWTPAQDDEALTDALNVQAEANKSKQVNAFGLFGISRRLWERLVARAGIPAERRWGELGPRQKTALVRTLKATEFPVTGQSTFKDEFVTCGGVSLKEVDLKTMESRITPGLHFAGEVLDIDGVTGGFNFQSCWTTGWLAGRALAGVPA